MLKNPESALSNEYNICKPYATRKKRRKCKLEKKKRQQEIRTYGEKQTNKQKPKIKTSFRKKTKKKTTKTSNFHEEKKSKILWVKAF